MNVVKLARPEIQALHPYAAADQVDDTVRLNANESPRSNGRFRRPLNRYPEVRPQHLTRALAQRFGCSPEEILVTRGSSEAIDLVTRSFCRAGQDSVMTTRPSFSMYRHYAEIQAAKLIEVASLRERDFAIDVDDLLASADDSTRLIFVCSPNNPTGTTLARKELVRLLDARAELSVVVVDEAYIEFGRSASVTDLLQDYPNLLVLRTLSKALGLAGARCGAVLGHPPVISMLNAVQAPYAMATPVVECVEEALLPEQLREAAATVEMTIMERERVAGLLGDYSFVKKIWPSDANFVLVQLDDVQRVMDRCLEHKVLVRHFGGELSDCLRISIGAAEENDQLLRALDTLRGA
jgi:histidinol-phosphate aminotransferase